MMTHINKLFETVCVRLPEANEYYQHMTFKKDPLSNKTFSYLSSTHYFFLLDFFDHRISCGVFAKLLQELSYYYGYKYVNTL
jgi:hypothetical protein